MQLPRIIPTFAMLALGIYTGICYLDLATSPYAGGAANLVAHPTIARPQ